MSERTVIIAALRREIDPLLRSWKRQGKTVERIWPGDDIAPAFLCGRVLVYCSGIGSQRAAKAAKHAIDHEQPRLLISAGLAGALDSDHRVGDLLKPATVVDASSGRSFSVRDPGAKGVLVTAGAVLTATEKEAYGQYHQAQAVDMEAAAVAEIADSAGVPFIALKAVSDPVNFAMPPLDRFIGPEGNLDLLHLMGWAALRPTSWRALAVLGRNSRKAAEELARELERVLAKLQ